jgi:hypothetical protein
MHVFNRILYVLRPYRYPGRAASMPVKVASVDR